MTQQDKDREAFEAFARKEGWALERYTPGYFVGDVEGEYKFVQEAWESWQAARDLYAPKMTETADEITPKAISKTSAEDEGGYRDFDEMADSISAIRAARVRFKE
jgi:hypothetical protein